MRRTRGLIDGGRGGVAVMENDSRTLGRFRLRREDRVRNGGMWSTTERVTTGRTHNGRGEILYKSNDYEHVK